MECDICSLSFDTSTHIPKMLNCGHTFCHICLQKMVKNNKISCPNCRKEMAFPTGYSSEKAIKTIPINYILLNSEGARNPGMDKSRESKKSCNSQEHSLKIVPIQPEPFQEEKKVSPVVSTHTENQSQKQNGEGCCCLCCKPESCCGQCCRTFLILLVALLLIGIICLSGITALVGINLIIGNIISVFHTDSKYFYTSLCFIFTFTFFMTATIMNIPVIDPSCCKGDSGTCCEDPSSGCCEIATYKYIAKILFAISSLLQIGATIFALITYLNDEEKDEVDLPMVCTLVSMSFTLSSIFCIITFSALYKCSKLLGSDISVQFMILNSLFSSIGVEQLLICAFLNLIIQKSIYFLSIVIKDQFIQPNCQ